MYSCYTHAHTHTHTHTHRRSPTHTHPAHTYMHPPTHPPTHTHSQTPTHSTTHAHTHTDNARHLWSQLVTVFLGACIPLIHTCSLVLPHAAQLCTHTVHLPHMPMYTVYTFLYSNFPYKYSPQPCTIQRHTHWEDMM